MIDTLRADESLSDQKDINVGVDDMELLLSYLEAMGVADKVSFDLSLARGLDYYSGLIFEVSPKASTQVGSIAAGGRYDGLVGMYGKQPVPCVGISFGVDRIFTLLAAQRKRAHLSLSTRRMSSSWPLEARSLAAIFWNV
uniref:Class II Histidinyl-tRNA synthetase (HisRS)-like catalytic core domain-containing protein n=1 Tax=Bionectria ochroleuca TaxID=29856 RepID=A0A8H7KAW4_BIOOC